MFNKFSKILEADRNVYQKGTPFSNGHRSRTNKNGFLLGKHLMIDIDGLIVDKNDKIVGIVEKKKRIPSADSEFQNILDPQVSNYQKLALLELSKRLACKLFVFIESEEKYYLLNQDFSTRQYTKASMTESISKNNLRIINTDGLIFLEFRKFGNTIVFKAVAERVSSSVIMYKYLNQLSESCGKIPTFQVDDTSQEITFRVKGKLIGKVKSVLNPLLIDDLQRIKLEQDWEKIYTDLGIWN